MADDFDELRYADRPGASAEIDIDAPPEAVFAAIADIDLPARFSSEFQGATWLDGATGPAVGARFAGRSVHPAAGEWSTTSTVVEFDPPRTFCWVVTGIDGDDATTWRFDVAPRGSGCTLRQSMQMGPGRSFINVAIESMPDKESRILHRRVHEHEANIAANLAGVKALVESAG